MKVLEQIRLKGNKVAVICGLFTDADITSKIHTNIGDFRENEFFVETSKNCFSVAKTRHIVIFNVPETKQVTSIEFV